MVQVVKCSIIPESRICNWFNWFTGHFLLAVP